MSYLWDVACLQTVPRAIENESFVSTSCAVGLVDGGRECYEHSVVVNSWGEILVDGGVSPGLVQTILDLDQVGLSRNQSPSLTNDRPYNLTQNS